MGGRLSVGYYLCLSLAASVALGQYYESTPGDCVAESANSSRQEAFHITFLFDWDESDLPFCVEGLGYEAHAGSDGLGFTYYHDGETSYADTRYANNGFDGWTMGYPAPGAAVDIRRLGSSVGSAYIQLSSVSGCWPADGEWDHYQVDSPPHTWDSESFVASHHTVRVRLVASLDQCNVEWSIELFVKGGVTGGDLDLYVDGNRFSGFTVPVHTQDGWVNASATVDMSGYAIDGTVDVEWKYNGKTISVDLWSRDMGCDNSYKAFETLYPDHYVPNMDTGSDGGAMNEPPPRHGSTPYLGDDPTTPGGSGQSQPAPNGGSPPYISGEAPSYTYNYGDDGSGGSELTRDEVYEAMREALHDEGNMYEPGTPSLTMYVPGDYDMEDYEDHAVDMHEDAQAALVKARSLFNRFANGIRGFQLQLPQGLGQVWSFSASLPVLGSVTLDWSGYTAQVNLIRNLLLFGMLVCAFFFTLRIVRKGIA